jgi:hypothetical protein
MYLYWIEKHVKTCTYTARDVLYSIRKGASTFVRLPNLESSFPYCKEHLLRLCLSFEGPMRLGGKPKKSPKTKFLEALERTFQILGTYKSGSSFPNQIRIFSKWKVQFYYF